jgi:hypothetical protein
MAKNSAAHKKKVKHAAQVLLENPRLKVRQAMLVAQFGNKYLDDVNIRRMIYRCRDLLKKALLPPVIVHCGSPLSLTDLSATEDGTESTAHPATNVTADGVPPPKRKKQRMTALALQKKNVEDRKQKKHKSDAHKEAVRLYLKEREKPGGMSLRQVQDEIAKKYSITVNYSPISRYANAGLLNVSPKKKGPAGTFAQSTYKLLCDALSSFIPINQMNARAGDNSQVDTNKLF